MSFEIFGCVWLKMEAQANPIYEHEKYQLDVYFVHFWVVWKYHKKTFGHSGLSVAVFTSDVAYFTFKGQQNCRFSENFQSKKLFWCWIILFQNNLWFDILFLKHDWSKVFRYNIKYWPKNPQSRVANNKKHH